jgi:hypothetical protein
MKLPDFIVKWIGVCAWCGGTILYGDRGSYDENDVVCHYECRELMSA